MSFNGSGLFVVNSTGQPVSANTLIESSVFNALTADLATALSTAICKDGQTTITANLPMAGYRHTGVGNASARTMYSAAAQIQDGSLCYGTVGGTADVITLTLTPAITAYVAGQKFSFLSSGANTGAVTINVSTVAAKAITKNGTTALAAGEIPSGAICVIEYDGTQFQLINVKAASTAANTFTGLQTFAAGADIATATTVDLTAATGNLVRITGTTATTGVTINNGQVVLCYPTGAWPLTYHATNMPIKGGASYTCAAGDTVIFSKDGNGTLHVDIFKADGTALVGGSSGGVVASMRNLVAFNNVGTPNSQIDLSADEVVVKDSSNASQTLYALSVTINIAASGANGLDTGSEASSTWYYLWAIAKADGTKAGLISASSTAPTFPSGYTYKALIGVAYNDGSSNFIVFRQHDRAWRCAERNVFTSTAGTTSYASLSLTTFIPPAAKQVHGIAGTTSTGQRGVIVAANSSGLSAYDVSCGSYAALDTYTGAGSFSVMLETAQTIYWKGATAESYYRMGCTGFDF